MSNRICTDLTNANIESGCTDAIICIIFYNDDKKLLLPHLYNKVL